MTLFAIPVSSHSYVDSSAADSLDEEVNYVEISLLTCQPHDEVYSLYGHTAIRVEDKANDTDISVNWGVFDSRKPNFVLRFVFGLTDYLMGIVPTDHFLMEYEEYGSGVYQQRLNLTASEKRKVLKALEVNYLPENREYRYNFFYDNCTSRARDVLLSSLEGKVVFSATEMQRGVRSFRDLIHWKDENYPWCKMGNDLLLGVECDRNTTPSERQFLPEVLMADFDSLEIIRDGQSVALVDSSFWLVAPNEMKKQSMASIPLTPLMVAIIVLLLVISFVVYERVYARKQIIILDNIMLFVYGIVGIVLFAMIFSEHPTVRVNLQIFLFSPLWLLFAFPCSKWVSLRYYVVLTFLIVFFVCNLIQDYAEGVNILALSLLIKTIDSILYCKESVKRMRQIKK